MTIRETPYWNKEGVVGGTMGPPTLHFYSNIPFLNIAIGRALNSNRRRK